MCYRKMLTLSTVGNYLVHKNPLPKDVAVKATGSGMLSVLFEWNLLINIEHNKKPHGRPKTF